jgi:hypothetical protein
MIRRLAAVLILVMPVAAGTKMRSLPLMFEPNMGQADSEVAFLARGGGHSLKFDRTGVSITRGEHVVKMAFRGGNAAPRVTGYQLQEGKASYFVGTQDRWVRDIPLYAGVQYTEVYPGIGLVFYNNGDELEYDFSVAPGADASRITLSFEGAGEMRIEDGDLVVKTGWGELRHRKPRVYQVRRARRSDTTGRFVTKGAREAGFEVDAYDRGSALVIDPVLTYGTYIGGTGADQAYGVAVDSSGSAYVVGETWPINFPKTAMFSSTTGNQDAFLIKLNPTGTAVIFAAYFGGKSRDSARSVAVNAAGEAYVSGFTYSADFPKSLGGYRSSSLGQADVFAIRVDSSGSRLVYADLIGGAGDDFASGIVVDSAGAAYICGYSSSLAFPTTSGSFQAQFSGGTHDAFVVKLTANGAGLAYATYIGGSGNDLAHGVAVNSAGEVYITGFTDSPNWPVRTALFSVSRGSGDAFVAKLSSNGGAVVFSTYLGGSQGDLVFALALDSSNNMYLTGTTLSNDFPVTPTAARRVNSGSYDVFVAKLNALGSEVLYSTYLGGEGVDQGSALAVDPAGRVIITGFTGSRWFPSANTLQTPAGGQDGFVAALDAATSSAYWASYLGGAGDDQMTGIALSPSGESYISGVTYSADFPTTAGSLMTRYSGGDGVLVKLSAIWAPPPTAVSVTPASGSGAAQVFTVVYSDTQGYQDISQALFMIADNASGVAGCLVMWDRPANRFYLGNDAATVWLGPVQSSIENSQCVLTAAGSSGTGSGNTLTVNFALSFKAVFKGTKGLFLLAFGSSGNSNWQLAGGWTPFL